MINKNLLYVFCIFFLFGCEKELEHIDSGADTFLKVYGNGIINGRFNSPASMIITENNEIVVISTILTDYNRDDNISEVLGIYVFKTDPMGFLKEEIIVNDSFPTIGRDIIQTDDGYYILGYKNKTEQVANVKIQPYLAKLDNDLSVSWENDSIDIVPSDVEIPRSLMVASNGEIIVLGNYIDDQEDSSAFVATFNGTGNLLIDYQYDLENADISLCRNIVEGTFYSKISYVMCFNELRTLRPSPTIVSLDPVSLREGDAPILGSDNFAERISEIEKAGLDNYLIIGNTDSTTGNPKNILLMKISQLGEVILERTYGNDVDPNGGNASYTGNSVAEGANGGFIILATKRISDENSDFFLVKTNGAGDVEWTKAIGGSGEELGVEVKTMSDGYVILGISEIAETRLITLVKTDLEGNVIK